MKNKDNENKLMYVCEVYDENKLQMITTVKKTPLAIKKALLLFSKKAGAYKKEIKIAAYQGTPAAGDGFRVTEKCINSNFVYNYKFSGGLASFIAHNYL